MQFIQLFLIGQWGPNRTNNIDGAEAVRVSHNAILISRMHLATIALLCKQTTDNSRTRHPPEPRWRHLSSDGILFVPNWLLNHIHVSLFWLICNALLILVYWKYQESNLPALVIIMQFWGNTWDTSMHREKANMSDIWFCLSKTRLIVTSTISIPDVNELLLI